LPEPVKQLLGVDFYPVSKILNYLSDDVKEDVERIKRYLKTGYLTVDNQGNIKL
jgi:hypothetical protein